MTKSVSDNSAALFSSLILMQPKQALGFNSEPVDVATPFFSKAGKVGYIA
jgi:hypothetical protein